MEPAPRSFEASLVRRYPHPVSRVYRAWTMPEHLQQWLIPSDGMTLEVIKCNLREGGEFYYRFSSPQGDCPVSGKFLSIRPEQTLIFSWLPLNPHPDAGKETVVSVFFRIIEPSLTEVEVRHTLFPDKPMCECHIEGWNGAFDRLAIYLKATN